MYRVPPQIPLRTILSSKTRIVQTVTQIGLHQNVCGGIPSKELLRSINRQVSCCLVSLEPKQ